MLSQTLLLARTAAMANLAIRRAQRRSAHRRILDALVERSPTLLIAAVADHYAYACDRLFARRRTRRRDATETRRPPTTRSRSGVAVRTAEEKPAKV